MASPVVDPFDDAKRAAQINEREKYSCIIGEHRRGRKIVIAEHLFRTDLDTRYRLKVVQYNLFFTKKQLLDYCKRQKIPLQEYPDRPGCEDDETL